VEAGPGKPGVGGDPRVKAEVHELTDGQRLLSVLDMGAQESLAEENARLRQQVADLKLTDELTGMPNKRAISQALELHLSRSRRYLNPLSTVFVHVDLQAPDGVHSLSTDPAILSVSRFLRDRLRWVDQIAHWEDNLFLLVLPETTEADARTLLGKLADEHEGMLLPELCGNMTPRLTFGLACWKKGDDMRTLLRHTLDDLRENNGV
jgi:diguanylate cyclase (GGDEF)-like protein